MQLIENIIVLVCIEVLLVPCPDLLYGASAPIPQPLRLLAARSSELATLAKHYLWFTEAMLLGRYHFLWGGLQPMTDGIADTERLMRSLAFGSGSDAVSCRNSPSRAPYVIRMNSS